MSVADQYALVIVGLLIVLAIVTYVLVLVAEHDAQCQDRESERLSREYDTTDWRWPNDPRAK